ncbi:MAG: LemA family protein [Candidatus Micrarchaeia archaeon]|jgi:LemA protein
MALEWLIGGAVVVLGVAAVAIVLVVVYYFNKIVVLANRIDNAWSQIDVQLKRRIDLIPNLVESVKGVMKQEKELFIGLADARESLMKAKTMAGKAEANNMITDTLKTIFARAEAYPQLKSNENMMMLQEELSGTESKIAYARQAYNDSCLELNNVITTIPGMWFAGFTGKGKEREYFKAEEADRKPVKVSF